MKKFHYFVFTVVVSLLNFAAIGESMLIDKGKTVATTSSAAGEVQSDGKKLLASECFADFLVLQFGERTKMRGKSNKKQQFVLNPLLVNREKLHEFMQVNRSKTAELWNCVNGASHRPFPLNNEVAVDDGRNGIGMMKEMLELFRMKINNMGLIAPSQHVQEKFYNAQCLLDLGMIEGKITMKKYEIMQNGGPGEHEEWFQELKDIADDKHQQKIVVSKEGAGHLIECLHKGKPFDVKIAEEAGPNGQQQHLLSLDGIDRVELVKIISKHTIPFSDWMFNKIGLNQKQKQCVVDVLFVSHFGAWVTEIHDGSGQQFVMKKEDFPLLNFMTTLTAADWIPFVECMARVSPFRKCIRNTKRLYNLVEEFYGNDDLSIPLSRDMQKKMHNAQCWLNLGALEGRIEMRVVQLMENRHRPIASEIQSWLNELDDLAERPIVISRPESVDYFRSCLHKGAQFGAKILKNTAQLQDDSERERNDLLKSIKLLPLSKWLYKELYHEQNCVANFLVRNWHVQTKLLRFGVDSDDPPKLWRRIIWDEDETGQPQNKVHANADASEFEMLESCLFRKAVLLRTDGWGEQYIDLDPFFRQSSGIFTGPLLTQELSTQSDCLAKFLAQKSKDICLAKTRNWPTGEPLVSSHSSAENKSPYIINYDSRGAYALSAEQCHLPERESGIYSEDSVESKEREEFKQLWDCGVRMTTMKQEGGAKTIDVRELLRIHTPEQLYLRGNLMEIFFSPAEPTLDQDDVCPICHEEYAQIGRIVVSVKRCKHHFHSHCIQNWMRMGHDSCPICKGPITNILQNPNGTFDVMSASSND